jgi:hypothetical protein
MKTYIYNKLMSYLAFAGIVHFATSDYLSSADLKGVAKDGTINESLMQKIWDISKIPLPFTDMIGASTHDNEYVSWIQDALQAQNLTNYNVDGVDATATGAIPPSKRVGNHSQISTKALAVTSRAIASNTVGGDALSYQLMMRQQELKRDIEGIMLLNQASVADDGNTTPGKIGGLPSWLVTNTSIGATGSLGGYNTSTGLTVAMTPGTKRAPSEATLRDLLQSVWTNGGNPTSLMSVPSIIRHLSEYMFTSTARIATLMSDTGQSATPQVAKGSVNVFVSDFGVTVEMIANRLMPVETAGEAALFILDPALLELSYLKGIAVEPLAKTGLAEKRQISADWSLKVLNEKGLGAYFDIDTTLAWIA